MKKNNKIILGTVASVSVCLLGYGAYELSNNKIHNSNIEEHNIKSAEEIKKELDAKKNNVIVIADITEYGYAYVHGDHTHFKKGQIPFNAKFLDSLVLKDSNYKFSKEDVLYEVEQGYIIKYNDKFYYYPKENVKQTNIISKSEAEKLTASDEHEEHNSEKKIVANNVSGVAGVHYPTSDGFLLVSENQIVGRTNNGIIVDHNGHTHLIFYKDLAGTKWEYLVNNNNKTEFPKTTFINNNNHDDGYVFNINDVVSEDEFGYVVKHGDHYHYILKPNKKPNNNNNNNSNYPTTPTLPNTNNNNFVRAIKFAGIDFPTSDNFLFDGRGIVSISKNMLLVSHNGHYHPVRYLEIINSKWQHLIPAEHFEQAKDDYNEYVNSINKKIEYIAKKENINKENIKLVDTKQGKALQYEKDGTTHSILLDNIKIDNVENNYSEEELEKINYLATKLGIDKSLIRIIDTPEGKALVYPHDDHEHTILLSDINNNSAEDKDDIEEKKIYISKVYGVPLEAITVNEHFFAFNDPSHAYDPTHIHPYLIPRNKLIIPEVTGDKEIDFENELLALAKRINTTPDKIKVVNGKFAISHGDHDHYLNILSGGAEEYFKNKLPNIVGEYVTGNFDKEVVNNKIEKLISDTNKLYETSIKEKRRIIRELEAVSSSVNNTPTNSTEGYIKMLDSFANKYIYKTNAGEEENTELTKKYNEALKLITDTNDKVLARYSFNKQTLIEQLNNSSKDENKINYIKYLMKEIERFDSQLMNHIINHVDYFFNHLESDKISTELREELAELIQEVSDTNFSPNLVPKLISTKIKLALELQKNETKEVVYGENYYKLQGNFHVIDDLKNFVEFMRDMFYPNELPENINNVSSIEEYDLTKSNKENNNKKETTVDEKHEYLAKQLGLEKEQIQLIELSGKSAFVYPHNDHKHIIFAEDIDITKPIVDPHTNSEETIEDALKKLGLSDKEIADLLKGNEPVENGNTPTEDDEKYIRRANNILKELPNKINSLNENSDYKNYLSSEIETFKNLLADNSTNKKEVYTDLVNFSKFIDELLLKNKNNEDSKPNEIEDENILDGEITSILEFLNANRLNIKEDNLSLKLELLNKIYELDDAYKNNKKSKAILLDELKTLKITVEENLRDPNDNVTPNPDNDLGTGW